MSSNPLSSKFDLPAGFLDELESLSPKGSSAAAILPPLPPIVANFDAVDPGIACKRKISQIGPSDEEDDAEALGFTITIAAKKEPQAKRARKKHLTVDFKDKITALKIIEFTDRDQKALLTLDTNFDERSGLIQGPCYLRAAGRSMDWKLDRSLKEHALQVKILGNSVTIESLLEAAYPDNLVPKKTLMINYQQEYFAIYNAFLDLFNPLVDSGHILRQEAKSLTKLITYHLTALLEEQDTLEEASKLKTLSELKAALLSKIAYESSETVTKEAFIDLITQIDEEPFEEAKAFKYESLALAQASNTVAHVVDYSKVADEFAAACAHLTSSKKPIENSASASSAGVPIDIYFSSEFEELIDDVKTGKWEDHEERTITLVNVLEKSRETFQAVVEFFFNQKTTHLFFYGSRGINPA